MEGERRIWRGDYKKIENWIEKIGIERKGKRKGEMEEE